MPASGCGEVLVDFGAVPSSEASFTFLDATIVANTQVEAFVQSSRLGAASNSAVEHEMLALFGRFDVSSVTVGLGCSGTCKLLQFEATGTFNVQIVWVEC